MSYQAKQNPRYLSFTVVFILALLITLIGCSSKNQLRGYLKDSLYYCEQYTRTMELVSGKGMSEVGLEAQAEWYAKWKSQLILVKANVERLTPPEKADYFHWLVLRSMDEAIKGTTKLADAYKEAIESFSDYPNKEQVRLGYTYLDSALITWRLAAEELEKLTASLKN